MSTLEKLLEAAREELILGEGQLEMQAVAKRANVSVGLAYHHFGSKAGLIAAVVEGFYSQLEEAVFGTPHWPSANWAEREKGRIGAYIAFHFNHPFAPLVLGALSRSPEVLAVETEFTTRQLAGGARMLRAAQQDGIVASDIDPGLGIALMIGGIRQALNQAFTQNPRPPQDQLTEAIWTFMQSALRLTEPVTEIHTREL